MSPQSDHGQGLFRLTYVSRAVLPVLARFDATVVEIRRAAQDNNHKLGVTSLLIAHRGWFIQALEGPRRGVSMLFAAIGRDLRHAQLELLGCGPAEGRLFAENMGVRTIAAADGALLRGLGLGDDFDPFKIDADRALSLMTALATRPGNENARH